jgi:hypothetical protein
MQESSKDAAIIQVLLKRLNEERLPHALKLKTKVDRGEQLTDFDMEFLSKVFEDAGAARKLADRHPELQDLVARVTALYGDITRKALENAQKTPGA